MHHDTSICEAKHEQMPAFWRMTPPPTQHHQAHATSKGGLQSTRHNLWHSMIKQPDSQWLGLASAAPQPLYIKP